MKVFVITADTTTNLNGEIHSNGYVYGVYASLELANKAYDNIKDTYERKKYEYTIEEFDVETE